eukprot:1601829-Amphidinium_carterae.1
MSTPAEVAQPLAIMAEDMTLGPTGARDIGLDATLPYSVVGKVPIVGNGTAAQMVAHDKQWGSLFRACCHEINPRTAYLYMGKALTAVLPDEVNAVFVKS